MELNIQRQSIAACELLLAATAEHPIECDVLLPDYCPDILRILDCRATGIVTEAQVEGSAFTVEGMTTVTLCYLGQVGGMRKTEYKIPFTKSFDLKSPATDPVFNIHVEQAHLTCRAASPRRLDIRGAMSICVRLWNNEPQEAICNAEGMGMQLRLTHANGTKVGKQAMHRFAVAEELAIPANKPPAFEIVRSDCNLIVQNTKPVAGRIVVQGDMVLHVLYKSDLETGQLETADYTLPISHIIDVDDAVENANCEITPACISLDCSLVDDYGTEDDHIRVEAQILVMLRFYEPVEFIGATDSYSTLYLCENSARLMRIPKVLSHVNERAMVREQTEAPEGITRVIDAWATALKAGSHFENGSLVCTCRLVFTALCAGEDGMIDTVNHETDVVVAVSAPGADSQTEFMPTFQVVSVNATLTGTQMGLSAEVSVSGTVIGFESRRMITEVSVDENTPNKKDPNVGLIIYYARSGENVWDISKRYAALPRQVMDDNSLEFEVLGSNQAIIIPTT